MRSTDGQLGKMVDLDGSVELWPFALCLRQREASPSQSDFLSLPSHACSAVPYSKMTLSHTIPSIVKLALY